MVSSSIGKFLGGITNNPGSIAILLGLAALFLFRKDIRGAFGSVGESVSNLGKINIDLPEINIPSFGLPTLPSLPNISLPSFPLQIFGPSEPQGTPADIALFRGQPVPETSIEEKLSDPNRDFTRFLAPNTLIPGRPVTLEQLSNVIAPEEQVEPRLDEMAAMQNVQSEINNQQFGGGGSGFIGGVVREIPISGLSLSDIIDRFNVSASQAADIRARANDDFGDFDFGSNTGSGIGSVVSENPLLRAQLPNPGQVSNSQFEGLSAQEIALRLTGGVISNF